MQESSLKIINKCTCDGTCTCRIGKLTFVDYDRVDFSQFDNIDIFKSIGNEEHEEQRK